jgi:3-oxoacyl-[acyl-carrier-protein] synthase II
MARRVAITGLGAVTPVGNDVPSTWESLLAGRSGIGPITNFDASSFPVRIADEVKGFRLRDHLPNPRLRRHLSRAGGFGAAAARQALADAAVRPEPYAPHGRGIAMGATMGRPDLEEMVEMSQTIHASEHRRYFRQAPAACSPVTRTRP